MEITQLNNVLKREDPTDLYNITEISFSYPAVSNFNIAVYFVTEFEEMRMDLISNLIYGSTEHVDFLCSLNNIKNPLSVKRGDEIVYVDANEITQFKVSKINKDDVRKVISNRRKRSKIDPNRTKYLEEKEYSLPPTITKTDYKPIKFKEGKTHIGGNIFNI